MVMTLEPATAFLFAKNQKDETMKESFIERKFSKGSLEVIKTANTVIADYQRAGFKMTLRQLYYQFVQANIIANKQTEYKRLGSVLNDGRLAGLIDWSAIEDRTRNLKEHSAWDSPTDLIEVAADQYREPLWASQEIYLENWIEKDALLGVLEPVCNRWRVPYFACRGNTSQSEQYKAGKRLERQIDMGKRVVILYLGDHDPTGIDITRDNADRLSMFSGHDIEVRRLALNMHQIDEFNLPPNPAKDTDSRKAGYDAMMAEHGYDDPENMPSWELDALRPQYIDKHIEAEILSLIDLDQWNIDLAEEEENREAMRKVYENWDKITDFVADL